MEQQQHAAGDARTPPVAVWKVLASLKGDALKEWRMAELKNRLSPEERGFDLPFPFGWFVIDYSADLAVGEVKPVRYFGQELALWRGEDGKARMLEAWCKHLGAHMGHGGKVNGNLLECPFHAWRYDETGAVKEIPYANIIPPQVRKACDHTWPVQEANGLIYAWYHPEGVAPLWELDVFPEADSPDWTQYERHEWLVYAPLQLMAENGVDVAHFKYIHGTATFPDYDLKFDGHRRSGIIKAKLGTPKGEVDGQIASGTNGPGQSWTRFTGISETLLVAGSTPVDKDLIHVRFAFTQPKEQTTGPLAGLARGLIRDICKQLDQDKVVWDRQKYLKNPVICSGDGPIAAFRSYYAQFYAEPGHGPARPQKVDGTYARKRA